VRFAPVDTMVILQNLARHVRQSPKPTGIDTLTLPGLLRLYAAPNESTSNGRAWIHVGER
jgi:hypothetical protein